MPINVVVANILGYPETLKNERVRMAYDRKKLEAILDSIPKGKVTRHGLIAEYFGTTARAVAPAICRYKKGNGILRVVKKGGYFPHLDDENDCSMRAKFFKSEGLKVSDDKRRVIINEEDMWKP